MSMKVTVSELREHLPDILDRAVKDDQPCIIERGGETYAVIVSARQWRRSTIGKRLDALGPAYKPGYKLAKEKQARAEELLSESKRRPLKRAERRELNGLLAESENIMLHRAEAMSG
jgi:prevent-host-death family protein